MKPSLALFRISAAAVALLSAGAARSLRADSADTVPLTLDLDGAKGQQFRPVAVELSADKPAGLVKEPAYTGKVTYGIVHLGNGPASAYIVALDTPDKGDPKIYFDKNRNGDLTDDGESPWTKHVQETRTVYGPEKFVARASYGTATQETSSGDYAIKIYQYSTAPEKLFVYRSAARVGMVTVDGKSHNAMVLENQSNGVFTPPADATHAPVWLLVDLNDDGKYASGRQPIGQPFKLGNQVYEATVPMDGSSITLVKSTKTIATAAVAAAAPMSQKPLLQSGTEAPDFEVVSVNGNDDVKATLAQYKGKIVILDFWATWCGPCQASMPHLQKVYEATKDQPIVVLAVCVSDTKDAYAKWVPAHNDKYKFTVAFDPAGRSPGGISGSKYNVTGIPTTYIIDKDGKVAESLVGFSGAGDHRLEAALDKVGIKVTEGS